MKDIYGGYYSHVQFESEKKSLHAKIHWLLIYKENGYLKLDAYFVSLLEYISCLNHLFYEPDGIISLLATLQQARIENQKGMNCDFKKYRKLILDAHSQVDKIMEDI